MGPAEWAFGSQSPNYKVINVGTSAQDVMIHLNFVTAEICEGINKQMKYDFTSIPTEDSADFGDDETAFVGNLAGCSIKSDLLPVVNYQVFFVVLEL
ncbi:MAG: hypothetical protein COB76_04870 [Alphaproteobacteria bacterium]|nr:MAG: hypothetical protein COB76_04870 [Alphaproteobacteria bacterium]